MMRFIKSSFTEHGRGISCGLSPFLLRFDRAPTSRASVGRQLSSMSTRESRNCCFLGLRRSGRVCGERGHPAMLVAPVSKIHLAFMPWLLHLLRPAHCCLLGLRIRHCDWPGSPLMLFGPLPISALESLDSVLARPFCCVSGSPSRSAH